MISSNFSSHNVKSILFTVVAPPEDIAVSIHLPVLLIFELSMCIELSTVNPVIFVLPVQKLWDRTQIESKPIQCDSNSGFS